MDGWGRGFVGENNGLNGEVRVLPSLFGWTFLLLY